MLVLLLLLLCGYEILLYDLYRCVCACVGIFAPHIINCVSADARTSWTRYKEKQLIRSCAVCSFIKLKLTLAPLAIANKCIHTIISQSFSLSFFSLAFCIDELISPPAFAEFRFAIAQSCCALSIKSIQFPAYELSKTLENDSRVNSCQDAILSCCFFFVIFLSLLDFFRTSSESLERASELD